MRIETEEVNRILLSLPQLKMWPSIEAIVGFPLGAVPLDWQFPIFTSRALGEEMETLTNVVAAMACLYKSIVLVDDLLDEPAIHRKAGYGRVANISLALQAAAMVLINRCDVPGDRRLAAVLTLNQAALDTAFGQEIDSKNLGGEENYWKTVQTKSTPYYGAAFKIGAQLGSADPRTAHKLYMFGSLVGELSQIYDDLEDAFAIPAQPDWMQGQNNLAILYGLTAEYPEKGRFIELRGCVEDGECLAEAQKILIKAGAVSYCIYQALQREKKAKQLIMSLALPEPQHLTDLFPRLRDPVEHILKQVNVSKLEPLLAQ